MVGGTYRVKIEFNDGSEFTLPKLWSRAFEQKFSGRMDEAEKRVKKIVEEHYIAGTKPGKEDPRMAVDWDEDIYEFKTDILAESYDTHADLAPEVIYPMLKDRIVVLAHDMIVYSQD